MKKRFITTILLVITGGFTLLAATYRTYVGHTQAGNSYEIWVNSDTAFGESTTGQFCYTPTGGGTAYTGFFTGTFDNTTVPGANWKLNLSVPTGATNIKLELANINQGGSTYGYTGCNISLSNVLPVDLISFSAAAAPTTTVVLNWRTAMERNNSHFEVERSVNMANWTTIGTVKSNQVNSDATQSYTFFDLNPVAGINYYRLKQVDLDGQFMFSQIANARSGKSGSFVVTPNPITSGTLKIQTAGIESEEVLNLQLYNSIGILVQSAMIPQGHNTTPEIDLAGLSSGLYVLRINDFSPVKVVVK